MSEFYAEGWYMLTPDKQVKPIETREEFEEAQKPENRMIAREKIGDITVSTVFLRLDHSWVGGTPLVFETMFFGGPKDQECERCSTYEEALAMHKKCVAKARALLEGE